MGGLDAYIVTMLRSKVQISAIVKRIQKEGLNMKNENQLHEKIKKRYEEESAQSCSLHCGSTLDELEISEGEWILDLGCGRGEESIRAAGMAGPKGMATGLDLTEAMIHQARDRAAREGVKNVTFRQGDIENLPFEENSFDGVMSNCVINHARDKNKVFCEIRRVLKPGGRFLIADAVTKYPLPSEVKADPEAWAQCFGGAITEEEYLQSILKAGFHEVGILNRRKYLKNGYDFISLTIRAVK